MRCCGRGTRARAAAKPTFVSAFLQAGRTAAGDGASDAAGARRARIRRETQLGNREWPAARERAFEPSLGWGGS
eukprot:4479422-Pleurochrysis_carterae.AAC.1